METTFIATTPPTLSKDTITLLKKWGLFNDMKLLSFSFDKEYGHSLHSAFLNSLFAQHLDKISTIKDQQNQGYFNVVEKEITTTVTRMDFFEPLYEHRIVNKTTDTIQKCMDQYLGAITLSDKLRCLFYGTEDSDQIFSEQDKDEFLYHIMKRVVIGGALMQYEDTFEPYFNVVKEIYKATTTVQKDSNSNLSIVNDVFQIEDVLANHNSLLFPRSPLPAANFCYVSIDGLKKLAHVWVFKYDSMW